VVFLQSVAASQSSWKQAWTGGQARKEGEYLGQLETQGGLELIWSYMQHIFLSLFFFLIFKIRFSCHWNISGENFLLSPTLSWAYWPTVSSDNPLFLFSLTGGQDDHLLHSLKKVLKELVSNKTMFGCFSPFKIGTHSSLKTSDWTDLKRKYFWKCVGSIYFWLSHSGKKFEAKFEFWKVSNIWTLL